VTKYNKLDIYSTFAKKQLFKLDGLSTSDLQMEQEGIEYYQFTREFSRKVV